METEQRQTTLVPLSPQESWPWLPRKWLWLTTPLGRSPGPPGCGQLERGQWAALTAGAGYFMHFSTSSGMAEEAALLESRILYPKRKQQCLQFFYKMTGSPSDRLVVWVRRDDSTGNVRKLVKVQTFRGTWRHSWGCRFGLNPGSHSFLSLPFPSLCHFFSSSSSFLFLSSPPPPSSSSKSPA